MFFRSTMSTSVLGAPLWSNKVMHVHGITTLVWLIWKKKHHHGRWGNHLWWWGERSALPRRLTDVTICYTLDLWNQELDQTAWLHVFLILGDRFATETQAHADKKKKNCHNKMQSHKIWCCFFLFFRSAGYKHVLQNIHFLTIHRHMSENSFLKQSEMTAHFSQVSFPKKKKNCPCKHPGHASVSEQQRKYTATKNHPFNLGWEREKKNKLQETTSNLMIHSCNISISS